MENERVEVIEACRTCGIFYMTSSNYLKHLFQSPVEQPDMMLIRLELAQWKVEVAENDGFPQYVCVTCIHEFQKVFKFRASCIETQEQIRQFSNFREENLANIKIKTERPYSDEDKPRCNFIYVDELSDTEYDGATPFNIPHVPIKEELIEAATIPTEANGTQAMNVVESASNVVNSTEHSVLNAPIISSSQNENTPIKIALIVTETPSEHVECKLCQHISQNNEDHKQHLQKAHENRDMECHICGKVFKNSTSSRLKFHMKWHTLNKHVKCTLCGFLCNSKDALKEHKRANHTRINCKICGKGVLAKKMKSHVRNHELLTKYPCEYCTETFSTEDERENHIWQLHTNENNILTTEISEEVNNDEQEEIMCQESEVDLLLYKFLCAHCDERFIEQVELETHVNERHRSKTHANPMKVDQHSLTNEVCQEMSDDEMISRGSSQISIFQGYDNDDDDDKMPNEHEQYSNENQLIRNNLIEQQNIEYMETPLTHITQTIFNGEHKEVHEKEDERYCETHQNDAETTSTGSMDSLSETESEKEIRNLKVFSSDDLKPFACAKCAETFASIEQLRQHHENHLTASYEQQNTTSNTTSKSKFKCNLCGKLFDLKFSLNRHVKKHKNAPI